MKIAIIGASYLQKPLVLKAKELGHETHCFAWEEGAVCKDIADYFYPISILDKEEICKKCQSLNIEAILSIASDAAVPTVNFVASTLNLISNADSTSVITTNKYEMRKCLFQKNISSPRFLLIKKGHEYDLTNLKWPLIVKPTDRSGSRGVQKINSPQEAQIAIANAQSESFNQDAIVEEYITGKEISIETISWKGKHYILAITDKVTTDAPYFVELEHHQPALLSSAIQEKVSALTINALNALNIQYGASHTEIKITPNNELYIIEVGARMGGDFIGSTLVQLSTGYDYLKGVIDIALGHFETPILQQNKFSGIYFLSKETEYLKSIIQENHLPECYESEITKSELTYAKDSSDRSGYLIYCSEKKLNLQCLIQ